MDVFAATSELSHVALRNTIGRKKRQMDCLNSPQNTHTDTKEKKKTEGMTDPILMERKLLGSTESDYIINFTVFIWLNNKTTRCSCQPLQGRSVSRTISL